MVKGSNHQHQWWETSYRSRWSVNNLLTNNWRFPVFSGFLANIEGGTPKEIVQLFLGVGHPLRKKHASLPSQKKCFKTCHVLPHIWRSVDCQMQNTNRHKVGWQHEHQRQRHCGWDAFSKELFVMRKFSMCCFTNCSVLTNSSLDKWPNDFKKS